MKKNKKHISEEKIIFDSLTLHEKMNLLFTAICQQSAQISSLMEIVANQYFGTSRTLH